MKHNKSQTNILHACKTTILWILHRICEVSIMVCSARRSKEAAAKQTFTLTGANRQNLRVRSTTSAQRLDFGGVDVFARRGCHEFFVTRSAFLLEPRAYGRHLPKLASLRHWLDAVASAALPTKAQAIATTKLCQPLPLNYKDRRPLYI